MRIVVCWGEPKPGYEFQYYLAWKHREVTAKLLNKALQKGLILWRPRRYKRIFDLWGNAVDRTKKYGQDRVYET